MTSLLVTGSRSLEAEHLVVTEIDQLKPIRVLVGCCPTGVDRIVRRWCDINGVECHIFTAYWHRLGRRAGPERNQRMVDRGKEFGATVLAFPREGTGTQDCIRRAEAAGLTVLRR